MIRNSKTEGSVTVFLSCILLLIIVLICTVIDGTRIQIAKMQAIRALRSATHSALASYDSGMAHEYGIFSRESKDIKLREEIKSYALAALQPEEDIPRIGKIHQIIYPKPPLQSFKIFDYQIDIARIQPTGRLVEHNTDYMKLQVLEYMKYRGPMLMIEPFLEKMELITKSAKTTRYVQEKMEVEHRASKVDDLYTELEKYIDGLKISKAGQIAYEDYFVKGISISSLQDQEFLTGIPQGHVRGKLNENIMRFYKINESIQLLMASYDAKRRKMVEAYRQLYDKRQQIQEEELALSQLEEERYQVTSDLQAIRSRLGLTSLNMNNDDYYVSEENQDEMDRLSSAYDSLVSQINSKEALINNLTTEEEGLHSTYKEKALIIKRTEVAIIDATLKLSELGQYLQPTEKAIRVIEQIEKESKAIEGSIEALQKNIQANMDEIIPSTSATILQDLRALKGRLALPDDNKKTYNLIKNVRAMKEELQANVKALKKADALGDKLYKYYMDHCTYYRLYGLINLDTETSLIQALIDEANGEYNTPYTQYSPSYLEELRGFEGDGFITKNLEYLKNIKDALAPYDYEHMSFDYGDMKKLTPEEKAKIDPREEVSGLAYKELIQEEENLAGIVEKEQLPSQKSQEEINIPLVTEEEVDFHSEKHNKYMKDSMSMFGNLADKIGEATLNLRDELYVNEYILGQFSSRVDQLPDGETITLSGYNKDEHLLKNEVEYVLRGSLNETINTKYVSHTILGIRFVMNYLHILTNTEKRTMIMGIATSIAGWWTFGLGVYIVAALMMAAWSYAESMVDMKYLLEGKGVPFLKTRTDWYTGLNGIINGVIDEGTELIMDKSAKLMDVLTEGVQNQLSHVTGRFSQDVNAYATRQMEDLLGQAERTIQYALDDVDRKVDEIIDDAFNHIRENIGEKPTARDYLYIEGNGLGQQLMTLIYKDYKHQIVDASYNELLTIKKEILDKIDQEIQDAKSKIIGKVTGSIEGISNQLEGRVNNLIDVTGSKYKDMTKKEIKRITGDIRKHVNDSLDGELNTILGHNGAKKKFSALMPSLSYRDYLRLMLLIGIDDQVKLYRVLDLVQFNLRHRRQDDELLLSDYHTGYKVTARVSVNYIFFGLPFMPDYIRDKVKNRYKFTIGTSMTY